MAKERLLKSGSDSNTTVVSGVTYFKLKSSYPNDFTKNCGLTGEEVDKNFYFLRGFDIDNVELDDQFNLKITRIDKSYEPFVINIGNRNEKPTFELNRETGVLQITYADGTVDSVEGFLVDISNATVSTNETLIGNGKNTNKLGLSPVEKTGSYSPVDEIVNLVSGNTMPNQYTCGVGYRILTIEPINTYGLLYKYEDVERISQMLDNSNSGWRVPSREDWDEMLNAFECERDRNHSAAFAGFYGNQAGVALKSPGTVEDGGLWQRDNDGVCGNNNSDLTIYPVGGGGARNQYMNDQDYDIEGATYGQMGYYWTTSEDESRNVFVKVFSYNHGGVPQELISKENYAAIRLVKDYDYSGYNTFENILGDDYPIKLVNGIYEDYTYAKLWTKINLYTEDSNLNGVLTDLGDDYPNIYCISEWDGKNWVKKPMNEGDTVVLRDKNGYITYMLIDGELVDVFGEVIKKMAQDKSDTDSDIETINNSLSDIWSNLNELSGSVIDNQNSIISISEDITEINNSINNVIEQFNGEIDNLDNDLRNVIAIVSGNVITLSNTIEQYVQNLNSEIANTNDRISGLTNDISSINNTIAEIRADINNILGTIDEFSLELETLGGKDIAGGTYTLTNSSEMVLLRENNDNDIKIKISDDFFDFGIISR